MTVMINFCVFLRARSSPCLFVLRVNAATDCSLTDIWKHGGHVVISDRFVDVSHNAPTADSCLTASVGLHAFGLMINDTNTVQAQTSATETVSRLEYHSPTVCCTQSRGGNLSGLSRNRLYLLRCSPRVLFLSYSEFSLFSLSFFLFLFLCIVQSRLVG